MDREGTPSATDLGHRHPRLQLQLRSGMNELVALRLFERVACGVAKVRARIMQVLVEEEPVEIGRNIVMVARVRGGFADRVRLMPPSQRPPDLAQDFLRNVTGKAGIDREQQDEIMDGRALLDREGAVHVSLAGAQLRIEEELGFEAGLVNADSGDRSREFAAENVETPRGVVQAQGAVLDEFFQQVRQQSHDAIPAQTKWSPAIISRAEIRRCRAAPAPDRLGF